MAHRLLILLLVGMSAAVVEARKDLIVPLTTYDRETRYINLAPADSGKFIEVTTTLTSAGTDWPGVGQIALSVPATFTDKVLVLLPGQGDLFPLNYGRLLLGDPATGKIEIVWLESRLGDVLTVTRGYQNLPPMAIDAGTTLLLLDLVTVQFEKTLDGVNWVPVGAFTCAGGPPPPLTPPPIRCSAGFSLSTACGVDPDVS